MVESYSKNANHNMRRPVVKEEIVSFMRERQAPVTDALKELEEFARRENIPIIPHETVAFFRLFLQTMQPKSILEIGTAIGFSALLMAEQVPDAKIMTIDRNEEMIGFAKENFARFDQRNQITLLEGDAVDLLEHIVQGGDVARDIMEVRRGQRTIYRGLQRLFDATLDHPGLTTSLIPLGDGILMIRKNQETISLPTEE